MELRSPAGAPAQFVVTLEPDDPQAPSRALTVRAQAGGEQIVRAYGLPSTRHADYLDLYERLAADFGLRAPASRRRAEPPPATAPLTPLLTTPLSPKIRYGYGDPSVLKVEENGRPAWYLTVTSNDAPDAFPILRSENVTDWRLAGFVFPEGQAPAWTLTGEGLADFWAPELHKVGEAYWLCFAARRKDHTLAIGLATADSPVGPFKAADEPLLCGGVIDPHIVIADGRPHLVWKVDDNDRWPPLLAALLHGRGEMIARLFDDEADRRTAAFIAALWPRVSGLEPMERFFALQPLIEAVTDDLPRFRQRLAASGEGQAIASALTTRIYAQPLSADGRALEGERVLVLENDRPWEAHLIEGVWISEAQGRWYMLYAGNDFSTPDYAVGAAVAERLEGPYRKFDAPLLQSSRDWWAPGHPSVAPGPDGQPHIFLHAFFPGQAGYKVFRALLTAPIRFSPDGVSLG